jgi:hypothetical protein
MREIDGTNTVVPFVAREGAGGAGRIDGMPGVLEI